MSSHRRDNKYHGLCYTSHEALAGMRNSPMGPPWRIDPTTHRTMGERFYHGATFRSFSKKGNLLLPHGLIFPLATRVLLCASSHWQDSTYHCLCYTSHWSLSGMRNSSMGPQWRIDPTTHRTMSERSYHRAPSRSQILWGDCWSCVL